jgi:16S rRNA (guanine1516-N2)-methyltransferase
MDDIHAIRTGICKMIEHFSIYIDPEKQLQQISNDFAKTMSLAVCQNQQTKNESDGVFEFIESKLALNLLLDGKPNQLVFDFADGEVGFRAARVSKANEVVSKAIGCKPYYRPKVLDATAGMGRDSLIMALLGCEVTMFERNFAIFQLLQNALSIFKLDPNYYEVSSRISLSQKNSIESFTELSDVDVIYLDPMFPARKKSALVKKEMRLFKLLAGEDLDADSLLESALNTTAKRVVVKRPKGAPLLAGKKPSHEIVAKKFRYDVYLINNQITK